MSSTNNFIATTGIDPPPHVPAADAVTGTSTPAYVRLLHEADLSDDSFQDNYALDDNENEKEFSLCQKMVHYIGGNMVTSDHWAAVKAVLVLNAGCIVNKHAPMTKENIQIECLAAYKKSIADLDPAYFSEAARTSSWLPTGTKVYQLLERLSIAIFRTLETKCEVWLFLSFPSRAS